MFIPEKRNFKFVIAAVLLLLLSGCGGGTPAAARPDNFRGVRWGTSLASLSGFCQIASEGDLSFYEKTNDPLLVDDVKVDQIIYGFHHGRFYTAMVYFPAIGFTRMKEILSRQLGEPVHPDNTPSKLVWDSSDVTVLLTLDNSNPDSARLSYLYKPEQLEVELKK
jgi:hypothetical protein